MGMAGVAAGGLALQAFQNNQANNSANSARRSASRLSREVMDYQRPNLDKMTGLADYMQKTVFNAIDSGFFDPELRIKQLEKDTMRYEKNALGQLGAAAATMGYKPGDTQPIERMRNLTLDTRNQLNTQREAIRQSSLFDMLNALNGTNPGLYGSAAGIYGQAGNAAVNQQMGIANMYQGQIQPLGPSLAAMMPYLDNKKKAVA